jgi:hypothetical protein
VDGGRGLEGNLLDLIFYVAVFSGEYGESS